MERNIVLLSGITDDQNNLLAAGGVNSATDLSMLEHDDVKGILTTASVVLTRKLWRIGKYVAAGQTVQATTTLADITTFFAMSTRPRAAAAAPVPPTAPNALEVMRGAPIQMRKTSELIPHPPFLLEEKKANPVAPEERTYDWKRFMVSFERSGKVGMTLRESKNTLDPVTDLTKGSQKQVTTVTRVVAKGQAKDAGVRANDVLCLFSYSPVNDYKTCPINVWHGYDCLINCLKLPERPVYALGLRKVRKKKVIVKKEKVVDAMPDNHEFWISSGVSVSPIINETFTAIPTEIRKNFRKVGFCKFGENWLPAIEVGPDDVAAHLSDEWMKKFKQKENYYTHLVYWYGDEPKSGYGWFEHEEWSKKFVSFGVGKKKGYSDVPIAIVKKLDKKMKLAKEQRIRLDAIHQIKGDHLLPKEKRIAWLTGTTPAPRFDENTETSKINHPEKRKQMDIKGDVDDEAKHRSTKLHSKRKKYNFG